MHVCIAIHMYMDMAIYIYPHRCTNIYVYIEIHHVYICCTYICVHMIWRVLRKCIVIHIDIDYKVANRVGDVV